MAGANTQLAGRVNIAINGSRMRSKSGAKLDVGGVSRTPINTDQGTVGFTEQTKEPSVECTIVMGRDTDLIQVANTVDSTLVFETDIGNSYVLKDAFLVDPPSFTGGEGEVSLKFSGTRCEKV